MNIYQHQTIFNFSLTCSLQIIMISYQRFIVCEILHDVENRKWRKEDNEKKRWGGRLNFSPLLTPWMKSNKIIFNEIRHLKFYTHTTSSSTVKPHNIYIYSHMFLCLTFKEGKHITFSLYLVYYFSSAWNHGNYRIYINLILLIKFIKWFTS